MLIRSCLHLLIVRWQEDATLRFVWQTLRVHVYMWPRGVRCVLTPSVASWGK